MSLIFLNKYIHLSKKIMRKYLLILLNCLFLFSVSYSKEKDSTYKKNELNVFVGFFSEATTSIPNREYQQSGGKAGHHTEKLGYILADMQYMQRAFPGLNW